MADSLFYVDDSLTASNTDDVVVLAAVSTDKADYAPGETATITASGFAVGSTITFALADDPNAPGDDGETDVYSSFTVTDGGEGDLDGLANGQVVTTWMVPTDNNDSGSGTPDALNATVQITAQGSDGQVAVTSFTDAAASTNKVYQHWADQVDQPQGAQWQGDILNEGKSDYFEGEVIPHVFFYKASNQTPLVTGNTYSFNVTYNYYQQNTDAGGFAYMTTYDISRQPSDFLGASPSISPSKDPSGSPDDSSNGFENKGGFIAGNNSSGFSGFYTVDADVISVSDVTYTGSPGQTRDGVVTITFKYTGAATTNGLAAIYYGLYVAKPGEVPDQGKGTTNGAGAWSGGSLQTTVDIGGSGATSIQLNPDAILQGEISGLKFNDLNGNGLKDEGELGIAGWTVYLDDNILTNGYLRSCYTSNGTTDDQDGNGTVDPLGFYYFSVTPDSDKSTPTINDPYYVVEKNEAGWTQTAPSSGSFGPLTVSATTPTYLNQNFGNFKNFSISGYKFIDKVGDGVWAVGKDGAGNPIPIDDPSPGWRINLAIDRNGNGIYDPEYDSTTGLPKPSSDELKTYTITGENGKYTFDNLGPLPVGQKYLVFEAETPEGSPDSPNDWTRTYNQSGYWVVDPSKDKGLAGEYLKASPGNFGNFKNLDLGCYKWIDSNGNGKWDYDATTKKGEAGDNGWTMYLDSDQDPTNGYIRRVDTASEPITGYSGFYEFQNITPAEINGATTLYVYEGGQGTDVFTNQPIQNHKGPFTKTYGGYSFDVSSGKSVISTYGATQDGNFGNFVAAAQSLIAIDKKTQDTTEVAGAAADNSNILIGHEVTWIYTVTLDPANFMPLNNVTVSDSDSGVTPVYVSGDDGDTILEAGESWIYEAKGTAVAGPYSNIGTASGSYTYGTGETIIYTAEDSSGYFGANPQIDVEKYVWVGEYEADGTTKIWRDEDLPAGPTLLEASGIKPQFKFVVVNTGNVDLSDVTLSDDYFNIDTADKTINIQNLAKGDGIAGGTDGDTYEFIYTGALWEAGQHTNTAKATGSYTDSAGHVGTVTASDDSNYFGANPQIDVEKYVWVGEYEADGTTKIWRDEDLPAGPTLLEASGIKPQFKFVVVNTGNVDLSDVTLSDDYFNIDTADKTINIQNLAKGDGIAGGTDGDTYEFIYTGALWEAGQHTNTAKATGSYTDSAGHVGTVTASDDSNYFGANPQIDVEKYVWVGEYEADGTTKIWRDEDLPAGPTLLEASGIKPQFKFVVVNTGNVDLSDVTLSDDYFNIDTADKTINIQNLAKGDGIAGGTDGDTYEFIYTGALWEAGQHTNTAKATGSYTDSAGHVGTVTASDDSNYFGANPQIDVEKYVWVGEYEADGTTKIWRDEDLPAGPTLLEASGIKPQFKFVVVNTGNVDLSDVTLSDDYFNIDTADKTINIQNLAKGDGIAGGTDGDTYEFIYTGALWEAGQHTNTAKATGSYTDSAGHVGTVTASDDSNYFGANPQIDVEKYVWVGEYEADGTTKIWRDEDLPAGPTLLEASGIKPQFKFVVVNTGNVDLSDVTLSDDYFNIDTADKTINIQNLAKGDGIAGGTDGDTYEFIYTGALWEAGQHTNTAKATGSYTDSAGHVGTVTASDDSNYFGANPQIDVEKYVWVGEYEADGTTKIWRDEDLPAGPTLLEASGIKPQFKFVVVNTGNVDLSDVTLSDDYFNIDTADKTINIQNLAKGDGIAGGTDGDTYEFIYTGALWEAGQHTNTAKATGSYTDDAGHSSTVTDTDKANYYGSSGAFVTNSALCTFDTNPTAEGKQFNLLFTPDYSLGNGNFKLSDSNPGQFYYNMFYSGAAGSTIDVTLNIPYPFVVQGAVPIHVYDDVSIKTQDGQTCLTPIGEIANYKLDSAGVSWKITDVKMTPNIASDDLYQITIKNVNLGDDGFIYLNAHLDYGLEKQTGWIRTGADNAEDNPNLAPKQVPILDNQKYVFSAEVNDKELNGSSDTIVNDNIFKAIRGVGGMARLGDEPNPNQKIVMKDASGKTVGSAVSDKDGWWFTAVDAPGKSSTYSVYWDKTGNGVDSTDPRKTITWGGPVKYVNVDFTQSALHLDSRDATAQAQGVAPSLSQDQLAPVIDAAKAYWGANGADISRLRDVDVLIGDLGGTQLGTADDESLITLDHDAAGYGWSDSMGCVIPGKVDLFSALTHEFGHILGYDHDEMGATLGIGERHLPFEEDKARKDQCLMASPCSSLF